MWAIARPGGGRDAVEKEKEKENNKIIIMIFFGLKKKESKKREISVDRKRDNDQKQFFLG